MEIAQAQTKVLRVIGKLILLGVLIVLLAKVFLALLALAAIGLLTYVCARAVYHRRTFFTRLVFRAKKRLIHSAETAFEAGSMAKSAARWTFCVFLGLAEVLTAFILLVCALVYNLVKILCIAAWKLLRKFALVMTSALLGVFCCAKKTAAVTVHAAGGTIAKIRRQSGAIVATFVEASSGALVGAMLGFVPSLLTHEHPVEARVWGAALFGAFLGIVVALSRTTWPKQEEPSTFPQN